MQQGSAQASIYSGSEIPRADALGFKTLVYLNDVAPLPESGMTTSVAKLESQRDQVKRVLRATVRALQYLKANRAGSLPVIVDFMQVPPDEAEMAYDGMVAAYSDDGTVSEQSLRYTIDAVKQEVGVTGEVATAGIVDFAPLYEVLGEMGISPGADRAR
jgi:ABC-type nitrate/sulfonate/bicarbonate transport system substrate-binding protein